MPNGVWPASNRCGRSNHDRRLEQVAYRGERDVTHDGTATHVKRPHVVIRASCSSSWLCAPGSTSHERCATTYASLHTHAHTRTHSHIHTLTNFVRRNHTRCNVSVRGVRVLPMETRSGGALLVQGAFGSPATAAALILASLSMLGR